MARIEQIDKVYVDVRQPAARLAALQAAGASAGAIDKLPVTIVGADGKAYAQTGRIVYSGTSIDAGTGDAIIRVLVDNPQRALLPGMFVRARVARAQDEHGLLVPQQAVLRAGDGQAQAWVLDGANQASLRPIDGRRCDRSPVCGGQRPEGGRDAGGRRPGAPAAGQRRHAASLAPRRRCRPIDCSPLKV